MRFTDLTKADVKLYMINEKKNRIYRGRYNTD